MIAVPIGVVIGVVWFMWITHETPEMREQRVVREMRAAIAKARLRNGYRPCGE